MAQVGEQNRFSALNRSNISLSYCSCYVGPFKLHVPTPTAIDANAIAINFQPASDF
jgi:hypothetical protein